MKKTALLLTVLMVCFIACVSVNAAPLPDSGTFRDFAFLKRDGFTTEITDLSGKVSTFPGALKVSSLEQHTAVRRMAAYAICCGDEVVLSVQLHDIVSENDTDQYSGVSGKSLTNGFYSIELPVGDGYTAFLTGLSPKYLEEMQASALDAILNDAFVSLENISFIDAEKQCDIYDDTGEAVDSDEKMCWAASTSNLLFYTGWARKAGVGSADYMYERLIDEFSDYGGRCAYGLQWFFNGYHVAQGEAGWSNDVSGYSSLRGYLPDYCFQTLVTEFDLKDTPENMLTILNGLRSGCGAELSYDHYRNWERTGGHSVTLWGTVFRTDSDLSNKSNWEALIISDSDNDVTFGENRRTAPNTLDLYQITPVCFGGYDSWAFDSYQDQSATKQNYDVRVQVIAEEVDSAVSKMIYDRWIQTDEFDSNGDLTWIITDFYVVSSRASSKLETLDDGTYRLWAEVKYSINESNNYQYMDYLNVGELTVLPSVPELTDVSHTVISATQTAIHYKVNSSECESLVVKVFYGTDAGDLTIMAGASYEDYPGGAHEDEILLELLPETTYYYRVELIVNNGEPIEYSDESMNFTTPAATQEGPEPEEPIVFALLAPGEQNTVMEAGQQAYYETAAPNEDGVWSFTFAGADGYVCVWDDEQSDWGEKIGFGIEDQSIVLPLAVK